MYPPYKSAFPSQYWTWNGHAVHYVQQGDRGPCILLIHGFGASTDHWRQNIEILSKSCQVWAIDLLGFGRSQKPQLNYTVKLWTEQLLAFCQEIIQAPTYIAGNSLGGYSALCFAVEQSEWIQGLILLNCAGPFSNKNSPPLTKTQALKKKFFRGVFQLPGVITTLSFFSFMYFRRRAQIKKTLLQVYKNSEAVTDRLVEEIYQPAFDQGARGVFASVFKSPPGQTLDELLSMLECPLSLIWGSADPWMTENKARQIVEHSPAAELVLVDAGHCPHDECPVEVSTTMLSWIDKIETQAKADITTLPKG